MRLAIIEKLHNHSQWKNNNERLKYEVQGAVALMVGSVPRRIVFKLRQSNWSLIFNNQWKWRNLGTILRGTDSTDSARRPDAHFVYGPHLYGWKHELWYSDWRPVVALCNTILPLPLLTTYSLTSHPGILVKSPRVHRWTPWMKSSHPVEKYNKRGITINE